jgi:hypothetical protein
MQSQLQLSLNKGAKKLNINGKKERLGIGS